LRDRIIRGKPSATNKRRLHSRTPGRPTRICIPP
jgi:hypothetical protein